jgi:hypothetical protein
MHDISTVHEYTKKDDPQSHRQEPSRAPCVSSSEPASNLNSLKLNDSHSQPDCQT